MTDIAFFFTLPLKITFYIKKAIFDTFLEFLELPSYAPIFGITFRPKFLRLYFDFTSLRDVI